MHFLNILSTTYLHVSHWGITLYTHLFRYLPEAEKAETALSIPIQHEPSIHYGLCESGAQSCCPVS